MPHPASALSFDCDVPADRHSSVSEEFDGPGQTVGGTVELIEGRRGKFVPVASVRLSSADDQTRAVLRLIAPDANGNSFDIVLTTRSEGGKSAESNLGRVTLDRPTPFRIELSSAGRLMATIGESSFGVDFQPIASGKAMILCSTGQFRFHALNFTLAARN